MTQGLTVSIDGTTVHCIEAGRGDPVILLHDFPGDSRCWRYSIDVLATRFRVLAPDLPGWGRSGIRRGFSYHVSALADHVRSIMATLGLERTSLVGLGFGGLVAVEFALRHQDRTGRLVVCAPRFFGDVAPVRVRPPSHFLGRLWFKLSASGTVRRLLRESYEDGNNLTEDLIPGYGKALGRGRTIRAIVSGHAANSQRLRDIQRELHSISAPTLVVCGQADAVSPAGHARDLAGRIPGAELAPIPHAGHYCNEESPAGFNGAVVDFLKRTEGS